MVEFVFHTIFWTLALYGLFEIIKNIVYLCTYTNLKSNGIYIVIAVIVFVNIFTKWFKNLKITNKIKMKELESVTINDKEKE